MSPFGRPWGPVARSQDRNADVNSVDGTVVDNSALLRGDILNLARFLAMSRGHSSAEVRALALSPLFRDFLLSHSTTRHEYLAIVDGCVGALTDAELAQVFTEERTEQFCSIITRMCSAYVDDDDLAGFARIITRVGALRPELVAQLVYRHVQSPAQVPLPPPPQTNQMISSAPMPMASAPTPMPTNPDEPVYQLSRQSKSILGYFGSLPRSNYLDCETAKQASDHVCFYNYTICLLPSAPLLFDALLSAAAGRERVATELYRADVYVYCMAVLARALWRPCSAPERAAERTGFLVSDEAMAALLRVVRTLIEEASKLGASASRVAANAQTQTATSTDNSASADGNINNSDGDTNSGNDSDDDKVHKTTPERLKMDFASPHGECLLDAIRYATAHLTADAPAVQELALLRATVERQYGIAPASAETGDDAAQKATAEVRAFVESSKCRGEEVAFNNYICILTAGKPVADSAAAPQLSEAALAVLQTKARASVRLCAMITNVYGKVLENTNHKNLVMNMRLYDQMKSYLEYKMSITVDDAQFPAHAAHFRLAAH